MLETSSPVPRMSIVVPVFNEAENVLPLARQIIEAMDMAEPDYELIFVDDGSNDGTWSEIRAARKLSSKIWGLRHMENRGQSAALWTGIQATRGEIIATLDGDLQNDPNDLPRMLKELNKVDFVSGKRVDRQDTWVRKVSSRIARWARRTVLKVDVRDTGCAVRVFKRAVLQGIFPFTGFHRFLPVLVHGTGARTLEVPVAHRRRAAGVSKYGICNRLFCGVYDLFAVAWYQRRRFLPVECRSIDDDAAESFSPASASKPIAPPPVSWANPGVPTMAS